MISLVKQLSIDHAKINLLDFDRARLAEYFVSIGEAPYRAAQIIQWVHQLGAKDFDVMTNISKSLRLRLAELCEIRLPELVMDRLSKDGTRKFLFKLFCGNSVETVFIPEEDRGTLCVSSQVGCSLNCTFCSTGSQGYNRDLTTSEIIGQVYLAHHLMATQEKLRPITNIVMMGMGEPLLNFDNVVTAMNLMQDDFAYGISKYRLTLSTAGVVPRIYDLAKVSHVALAISLHAPNDLLRSEIVPLNKKYPIAQLMQACQFYFKDVPRRHITMEYVMLKGVNDQPHHARELIELLRDIHCKVNLIPFNPFPGTKYECSDRHTIERFRDMLMQAGLQTMTRKTRGDDIDAACGQLAGEFKDRTKRSAKLAKIAIQVQ